MTSLEATFIFATAGEAELFSKTADTYATKNFSFMRVLKRNLFMICGHTIQVNNPCSENGGVFDDVASTTTNTSSECVATFDVRRDCNRSATQFFSIPHKVMLRPGRHSTCIGPLQVSFKCTCIAFITAGCHVLILLQSSYDVEQNTYLQKNDVVPASRLRTLL